MKKFYPIIWLTIVFLVIAIVFAPQFDAMGQFVHDKFGMQGLFFTVFLADFTLQPFPPDVLLYSYVLSGSPIVLTWLLVAFGSALGACAGYGMGYFLQYEGALKFIGEKKYQQACDLFKNYGTAAVLIAAITPVPFNVVCWSAGIFKMDFRFFLPSVILARGARFVLVILLALNV
ncbi:DedA family protein [Candidatus Peregrinibacteria bacterium]|nr:DedA family protein [Candidatus Peregrinibacteria bacterium]MBT4631687.1 DedA family protein [Candidatus Peregrinibacteria bacterium]MBT5824250.1 DedA family protein [Candidatus Peregrinibacteria bacterium]